MKTNNIASYAYSFIILLFSVITFLLKFFEINHQINNKFTTTLTTAIPGLFLATFFAIYFFAKPLLQRNAVRISTIIYLSSLYLFDMFSLIHVTSLDRIISIVIGFLVIASIYKKLKSEYKNDQAH